MMTKYISVGKIVNFHGIKGEARVGYSKNQQEFFLSLKSVFVKTGNEYRELNIGYLRIRHLSENQWYQFADCVIRKVIENLKSETRKALHPSPIYHKRLTSKRLQGK